MLTRLLARLEPVHLAATAAEREAIYRLRYEIYVEEHRYEFAEVDHAQRMVRDADDEAPCATHLYVGEASRPTASLRIRAWGPGEVPATMAELLSLDLFPGIEKLTVAEVGRFIIRPSARGKLIMPAFAAPLYAHMAGEKKVDLAFLYCRPGLVKYYRRIGGRPYCGRPIQTEVGAMVPMVVVLSDRAYLKDVGAIQAGMVKKYFGPGKRPPLDTQPFARLLEQAPRSVVVDPSEVWLEMQREMLARPEAPPPLLEALGESAMKRLAAAGFVLEVPAGALLFHEGASERELYVVVEGTFEAFSGDRVFSRMGRGDSFGEVAFFRESGTRSASVRAVTPGRILAIRRSFLEELGRSDPEAASRLLFNLGRILANRVVELSAQA